MKKVFLGFFFFIQLSVIKGQIVVSNTPPNDNPSWLIDNILLGGGITASNHSFQGASAQIGFFNALNTSLGIDSGIIMSTGDIYSVDPINIGLGVVMPVPAVTDPDLLAVADTVPSLIGQTFSVTSVNDIAVLEFDFIPTSDSLSFRYVFGSEEYFGFENSSFNDVFGFFLSGPGISGPYANGAINLAIVPNSIPPLPITISSVNGGYVPNGVLPINQQYFVDNSYITSNAITDLDTIASADGLTTVLTAKALVQCNETYHIKLAIADGTDGILDSYVWLEAGSFSSPVLEVVDNLGIDSLTMEIPCNSSIILTADGGSDASYQWFDSTGALISVDSFIIVGAGTYWVEASSFGCPVISDTLKVVSEEAPVFELGSDYTIGCNTKTILDPIVTGGLGVGFYQYLWTDLTGFNLANNMNSSITVGEGVYMLEVNDGTGCYHRDTIIITEDAPPSTILSGGGSICNDGSEVELLFSFDGLLPWNLVYSNGVESYTVNDITDSVFVFKSNTSSIYSIDSSFDINGCIANSTGEASVLVHEPPIPIISPLDTTIYIGDAVHLSVGEFTSYRWYENNDSNIISINNIYTTKDSGSFYVWVEDENGCIGFSDIARVKTMPKTELFIPSSFTPNHDDHNELFRIETLNVEEFKIQIFNRWGDLLFQSNQIDKYWDGVFNNQLVPEGVYYFQIEVLGMDGYLFRKDGQIRVIY